MAQLIFVDSSFLYAGAVPEDPHHRDAPELQKSFGALRMITTNHVRGETWTLTNRRKGHRRATLLVDSMARTGRLEVAHVQPDLEEQALAWLGAHDEHEYSFVDATSFAFMRANRITDALAFDGDFSAAGFTELRP